MALLAAVFTCSMSSIFFKYMTAPSSAAAAYRLGFTVLLLTPAALGAKKTRRELFPPRLVSLLQFYFIREQTIWVYLAGSSRGKPAMRRACW